MIAPSASYSLTVRVEIIPSVFNKHVAAEVARAVAGAAHRTGVARRRRRLDLAAF